MGRVKWGQVSPQDNGEVRYLLAYSPDHRLMAQVEKNLPAVQEMVVQSLGWEDPLEKEMATHSYSSQENSMNRGAWWAIIVHGVTNSQT